MTASLTIRESTMDPGLTIHPRDAPTSPVRLPPGPLRPTPRN